MKLKVLLKTLAVLTAISAGLVKLGQHVEDNAMKFEAKKPDFNEVDGEYVTPIRFSEELLHNLLSGWTPIGFGWACLRPRQDGSFDLFIRQAALSEDMNLVKLDAVQQALMAALDLADKITAGDSYVDDETEQAANEVRRLVQNTAG